MYSISWAWLNTGMFMLVMERNTFMGNGGKINQLGV